MKIYTPEECEKWIGYDTYFNSCIPKYGFRPRDERDKVLFMDEIIDIKNKCFHHDPDRVLIALDKLKNNFPKFEIVLGVNFTIFNCPKPALGSINACAYDTGYVVLFARGTQIPHCMTDYIIGHEFGHVMQFMLCPKYGDATKFREYLKLRNAPLCEIPICTGYDEEKHENKYEIIEDYVTYSNNSIDWDKSPQEWFAEDFRYFFGADTGEPYWGLPIPPPDDSVKEFLLNI